VPLRRSPSLSPLKNGIPSLKRELSLFVARRTASRGKRSTADRGSIVFRGSRDENKLAKSKPVSYRSWLLSLRLVPPKTSAMIDLRDSHRAKLRSRLPPRLCFD
jgi:hypothetical protein